METIIRAFIDAIGMIALMVTYDIFVIRKRENVSQPTNKDGEDKQDVSFCDPPKKTLTQELEEKYIKQKIVYSNALSKWSNLYDKAYWKKGTLRENVEAELLIADAEQEKYTEKEKLDRIECEYRAAVRAELLNVRHP